MKHSRKSGLIYLGFGQTTMEVTINPEEKARIYTELLKDIRKGAHEDRMHAWRIAFGLWAVMVAILFYKFAVPLWLLVVIFLLHLVFLVLLTMKLICLDAKKAKNHYEKLSVLLGEEPEKRSWMSHAGYIFHQVIQFFVTVALALVIAQELKNWK